MVASRAEQTAIRRVDIAVYSKDDKLQLVVEVKSKTAATADWAAQMRRNLAAHLAIPTSPFFLLALPDHFYLWRDITSPLAIVPPGYDIDPAPFLSAYVADPQGPLDAISGYGLELAVSSWLTDLVNSDLEETTGTPQHAWLFDSGLYQAIKGGVVRPQAAL